MKYLAGHCKPGTSGKTNMVCDELKLWLTALPHGILFYICSMAYEQIYTGMKPKGSRPNEHN